MYNITSRLKFFNYVMHKFYEKIKIILKKSINSNQFYNMLIKL